MNVSPLRTHENKIGSQDDYPRTTDKRRGKYRNMQWFVWLTRNGKSRGGVTSIIAFRSTKYISSAAGGSGEAGVAAWLRMR